MLLPRKVICHVRGCGGYCTSEYSCLQFASVLGIQFLLSSVYQVLTHTKINKGKKKTEKMKELSRTLSDIFYSVIVSLKSCFGFGMSLGCHGIYMITFHF